MRHSEGTSSSPRFLPPDLDHIDLRHEVPADNALQGRFFDDPPAKHVIERVSIEESARHQRDGWQDRPFPDSESATIGV
jgi:hypothetical protein